MNYKEITGDLVKLGLQGSFDVILHGCNCFCAQKSGLAPQMAKAFNTNKYSNEALFHKGEINKLGTIQYGTFYTKEKHEPVIYEYNRNHKELIDSGYKKHYCVNAYTQYSTATPENPKAVDYQALALCLRKINIKFKGLHIGIPQIGCGLAGGNWDYVSELIRLELSDCKVTVVIYKP